jgi:dihydrolipoamide dehydrogenase
MDFDVIIIGSGPGGYIAAVRCGQLGLKTAIIEKDKTLGGTCLNVGCIPSKALLDSSEHFYNAAHTFKTHGIELKELQVNLAQMIKRKNEVVDQTVKGVDFLMNKNKVKVFHGWGSFVDPHTVKVSKEDGSSEQITSKNIIIATGSRPTELPFAKFDFKRILSSTEALNLPEVPKHLIVIGAGVIGAELGSVYARLGAKVTFIEFMDSMIPTMDKTMGKELQKALRKMEMEFFFKHKVKAIEYQGEGLTITAENEKGETVTFNGDYCLVSVGRRPYTEGLALENAGLRTDDKGRVVVDEHFRTALPHIYAIGDVIQGVMLAHKAEEEGVVTAEIIAGQKPHINYLLIPNVVYTWPEVASVGYTEEELKAKNIPYNTGTFPFKASGRARASMDTDGLVKVLSHKETDEILGVHMIGPRTADMIAEAVVAMEFRASAEDIGMMSHAHPTFTEAFKEACLVATGKGALNM